MSYFFGLALGVGVGNFVIRKILKKPLAECIAVSVLSFLLTIVFSLMLRW
jgi:hypothetical protein